MKVQVSSPSYLGSSCTSFPLQAKKVPPQIEVGLDAEIRLAEGDKNEHSKNRVWVEIANANPIIVAQLSKKEMARIPKSTPVKILKTTISPGRGSG
jgi:hypothetical protein